MTNTHEFARRAEAELRATRTLNGETQQLLAILPNPERSVFSRAAGFIAGDDCGDGPASSDKTSPEDRMMASRLMLLKLRLDTSDPLWSSEILSRYIRCALSTPDGSLNDVLIPLSNLVGESDIELSPALAQFLKDVVVFSFTQHRPKYDAINWNSFIQSLGTHPTQAQCYLAFLAIPTENLSCSTAEVIVTRLAGTRYQDEVMSALAVSR
jgi:hypothetical protein